jgi:TetR/AcrR family transcriptional regulator
VAEGRINQFVRSGYRRSPLEMWEDQWQLLLDVLKQR